MQSKLKILAVLGATIGAATFAGAQGQGPQRANSTKPAEFKCPTCGSPCVSKAEITKQRRQRVRQAGMLQQRQANATVQPRRNGTATPQRPQALQRPNAPAQSNTPNRNLRFDIDQNGQLSPAELAARKAYRQARQQAQETQPARRPAREQ